VFLPFALTVPVFLATRVIRRLRPQPFHAWLAVCALALATLTLTAGIAQAQTSAQYRGFWVDTYNTHLSTAADVTATVARAQLAGANALFVQVRRRGDSWYLQAGAEPAPEGVGIDTGFDPLQEIIGQAHAAGIEVHAFVVLGAVWSQTTVPVDPRHIFAAHGFTAAGPIAGRNNWLTRATGEGPQVSMGGYRFGTDYWLDFGHPDAAAYTVDLLNRLVSTYDIDGLHLDRIQYPDPAPTIGPPEAMTFASALTAGYNEVNLDRYRKYYGLPSGAVPGADDPAWSDWRRAQITALMRRVYLNVIANKPRVKVSAGVVASGNAPADDGAWPGSEPYARVFQDWRAWLEQGLLDLAVPLNFRAEHQPANADAFGAWTAWIRSHQYQRFAAVGVGAYLNSLEGTVRQIRRAVEPAVLDTGVTDSAKGVVLYSMGAHNAPVQSNPLAVPSQRDTPFRAFEDVAAGLRTGRTLAGQTVESRSGAAVFAQAASTPLMPWKVSPQTGFLMGTITGRDGAALDTAAVFLESDDAQAVPAGAASTTTDGGGFYGATGLLPGTYHVAVQPVGDGRYRSGCSVTIQPGAVSTLNLSITSGNFSIVTCVSVSPESRR
jgi:uncharacterized lipoprotein YddW (UPF0748 family)